jgi:hypothetical protein
MGATLTWLKVIDNDRFRAQGGHVEPGLPNVVDLIGPAPAEAAPFVILRAWHNFDTAFTESWRIVNRYGQTIHEGIPREVIAGMGSVAQGGIADEVAGQSFEFADEGYQVVLEIEGREVARADFEVREPSEPTSLT